MENMVSFAMVTSTNKNLNPEFPKGLRVEGYVGFRV